VNISAHQMERNRLLDALDHESFSGAYLAVGGLRRLFQDAPQLADSGSVDRLGRLILTAGFSRERQAFFLYRSAAELLIALLNGGGGRRSAPDQGRRRQILDIFDFVLQTTQGPPHRAAAEAAGTLPLGICGPALPEPPEGALPCIGWRTFLQRAGAAGSPLYRTAGRSLVVALQGTDEVLVAKLARHGDHPASLFREAAWAELIRSRRHRFFGRFDIPRPLTIQGSPLFRLQRSSLPHADAAALHPMGFAVAFRVHRDYFYYPNSRRPDAALAAPDLLRVLCRNARLLGQLSAMGIVHTAPIPLFHNRTQQHRRSDLGVYAWHRGGRLDRWLLSSRHPNFGLSGIRDFEHFESVSGSARGLYRAIGTHLLGLILVAASFFRHKEPDRVGFDASGGPVDVRHLFDPSLFEVLVKGIFRHYYAGFVGREFPAGAPIDVGRLVSRMIEEMGVDRHMEETLRTADQENMSDIAFREHLLERGLSDEEISGLRRGEREIVLHTGPHLGGFNQPISLPELIHFMETSAAICVAHRYLHQGFTGPGLS